MIHYGQLVEWEKEDLPYFDLTTHALGIGRKEGVMSFYSREKGVLSGAEEAVEICKRNGLTISKEASSGDTLLPNQVFFSVKGSFSSLYNVNKVIQNIFEYASGIATRTEQFVQLAREVDEDIAILTTRKTFPGTKELSIKSILAGGALPHRLGLSESILLFKHHLNFCDGEDDLRQRLEKMKKHHSGKKIFIEANNAEEARRYSSMAIDGLQYDKFPPDKLALLVKELRQIRPEIVHLATGGINKENVKAYANTGVDAIVTTSLYYGKPLNIGINITPVK